MYSYKKIIKKNGFKIIHIQNRKPKLVTLKIHFKLGNDSEIIKKDLEITHFLEHLFCVFTSKKYPDGMSTREYMSNNNIELDAEVINKNISFTLEFKKKHTSYVLDLVQNALLDFQPDAKLFKQEKNAVIEELNDFIRDSDYNFETHINSIIYKNHPRKYTIKERLKNCKNLKPKNIYDFYKTHFNPKNMVIGLYGDFEETDIKLLVNTFSSKRGTMIEYESKKLPFNKKIIYFKKDTNVSNLKIIFKLPYTCFNNISYRIDALLDILSGDLNSVFLKRLRTEQGLIYSLSMDCDCDEVDSELSHLTISTTCNQTNLIEVLKSILEILIDSKNILFKKEYIDKYIEQENIDYNKEKFSPSPVDVLEDYMHYFLWDKKIVSFEDNYKNAINIDAQKLKETANTIFDFKQMVVCYDGKQNLENPITELINCACK